MPPTMTPDEQAASLWRDAKPNPEGLVPCLAQDRSTGAALMLAWVSEAALAQTLETGYATYYSRSRECLWEKGKTSGHRQKIIEIRLDCDGDTLLYLVDAILPACHTGTDTCFHHRQEGGAWMRHPMRYRPRNTLKSLDTVIQSRFQREATDRPSYTKTLIDGGTPRQTEKLAEECAELSEALRHESRDRVIAEGADLLFHMLVALRARGAGLADLEDELGRRFGISGIDEKSARAQST